MTTLDVHSAIVRKLGAMEENRNPELVIVLDAEESDIVHVRICCERENIGPGKRAAPAVAAGVIPEVWTVADLVNALR